MIFLCYKAEIQLTSWNHSKQSDATSADWEVNIAVCILNLRHITIYTNECITVQLCYIRHGT